MGRIWEETGLEGKNIELLIYNSENFGDIIYKQIFNKNVPTINMYRTQAFHRTRQRKSSNLPDDVFGRNCTNGICGWRKNEKRDFLLTTSFHFFSFYFKMWIFSLGRTLMKTMPTILPLASNEHSMQQQHHSSIVLQATIWKMCKDVEERASLMFLLNVSIFSHVYSYQVYPTSCQKGGVKTEEK